MRKLVVNTFLTLDGVMQAPGGPEEDPSGRFEHGGWSVTYWNDVVGAWMDEFMARPFDLLLGRRTYEIFAAYWPHAPEEAGAGVLNSARKYVASRTLQRADWNNSTLIRDLPADVTALKQQDGPEIQVHGSSDLLQTLFRHDLVDVVQTITFPVVVGTGKRLFGDGTQPRALKLVQTQSSSTGVIIARYEFAGAIETGTFALDAQGDAGQQADR